MYAVSLPPPYGVSWMATRPGQITFDWSPVAPNCSAIHYNILALNCGNCPTVTANTTITCVDVPTDGSVCTFALETVICGNITGSKSDPVYVQQNGSLINTLYALCYIWLLSTNTL